MGGPPFIYLLLLLLGYSYSCCCSVVLPTPTFVDLPWFVLGPYPLWFVVVRLFDCWVVIAFPFLLLFTFDSNLFILLFPFIEPSFPLLICRLLLLRWIRLFCCYIRFTVTLIVVICCLFVLLLCVYLPGVRLVDLFICWLHLLVVYVWFVDLILCRLLLLLPHRLVLLLFVYLLPLFTILLRWLRLRCCWFVDCDLGLQLVGLPHRCTITLYVVVVGLLLVSCCCIIVPRFPRHCCCCCLLTLWFVVLPPHCWFHCLVLVTILTRLIYPFDCCPFDSQFPSRFVVITDDCTHTLPFTPILLFIADWFARCYPVVPFICCCYVTFPASWIHPVVGYCYVTTVPRLPGCCCWLPGSFLARVCWLRCYLICCCYAYVYAPDMPYRCYGYVDLLRLRLLLLRLLLPGCWAVLLRWCPFSHAVWLFVVRCVYGLCCGTFGCAFRCGWFDLFPRWTSSVCVVTVVSCRWLVIPRLDPLLVPLPVVIYVTLPPNYQPRSPCIYVGVVVVRQFAMRLIAPLPPYPFARCCHCPHCPFCCWRLYSCPLDVYVVVPPVAVVVIPVCPVLITGRCCWRWTFSCYRFDLIGRCGCGCCYVYLFCSFWLTFAPRWF